MTRAFRLALLPLLLVLAVAARTEAGEHLRVRWHPAKIRPGDVAWVHVRGTDDTASVEGSVGGRPLVFFPYGGGWAAVAGFDIDVHAGLAPWSIAVLERGHEPERAGGRLRVLPRTFRVQRLTLPPSLVDLDPETEHRAVSETEHLTTLYRMITPERLWHGRFVRPVRGTEPGSGFGARRVINGEAKAPHAGADYRAPAGTPVVAANAGRVALVADYFFPGRLVVLDHGLGLYTLYFHLSSVAVSEGDRIERGQVLGAVGATGRATGPHLHFGTAIGGARVDPAALLGLKLD